ncbi:hypothetical protein [Variovorax boronicumulans]|uniref:hypothetical protein n=1 Tax=Variovorax boronicumulans TaxID=436515 RepID=UPI001C572900
MTTLQKLRGDPRIEIPLRGRTLTIYGQGARLGLFSFVATVVLFNLPWHWIPGLGDVLQALVAAAGFYLSAALIGSLRPTAMDAETSSRPWF